MASKRPAPSSSFSTPKRVPTSRGWRTPTAQTAAEHFSEQSQFSDNAPLCCGVQKSWFETGAHNTKGNAGRRFYQCEVCNSSFEWIDHKPTTGGHSRRAAGGHAQQAASSDSQAAPTFPFDPSTSLHKRLLNASQEGNLAGVRACLAAPREQVKAAVNLSGQARSGTRPATPLRFASFHGFGTIVQELLAAGALASLLNENGQSALDLADIGQGHESAKGLPADRPLVLQLLRQAKREERFEIVGVNKPAQLHLNGLVVDVIEVRADGKYVVRAPGHDNKYSIAPEKMRQATEDCLLTNGSRAVICGLNQEGYNGAAVEIVDYVSERQRYQIKLLADGKDYKEGSRLSVKPKNLKPI